MLILRQEASRFLAHIMILKIGYHYFIFWIGYVILRIKLNPELSNLLQNGPFDASLFNNSVILKGETLPQRQMYSE